MLAFGLSPFFLFFSGRHAITRVAFGRPIRASTYLIDADSKSSLEDALFLPNPHDITIVLNRLFSTLRSSRREDRTPFLLAVLPGEIQAECCRHDGKFVQFCETGQERKSNHNND